MEYFEPYPSSVPHMILVPQKIEIKSMFYGCSMVIECFFLGICAILLAFSFFFKCGNHKLLIDQSNNKTQKKGKQNIICEVVARTNFLDKQMNDSDSDASSQKEDNKTSLQGQLLAGTLRIYERRLVYAATFTIPWVICINFFDADIVVIIMGAVFMALVILFNIRRTLPDWKISTLVYFVPALAAIFPYIGGTHSLYNWTPVLDPLKLKV